MIHDPQYLIGKDADARYKQEQQKVAKSVFKANKEVRQQIKDKEEDIKDKHITMKQANLLGISETSIQKRVKEGKLKKRLLGRKNYYSRDEIIVCLS